MKTLKRLAVPALGLLTLAIGTIAHDPALAAGNSKIHIERQHWPFGGFFGQFDKPQLRRGFQVYQEVCSACHGLSRVYFRNLAETGGPEFPVEAVKELAKNWPNQITDGPNDEGEMFERPAKLSDPILGPFKNDKQARYANNGALPVDLSLITKARTIENHQPWYQHILTMLKDVFTGYQEAGADYIYALLTQYKENPPAGFKLSEGMSYNAAFPGHQIAMVQPIPEGGAVEYQENAGAEASLEQNAKDVTAFLAWTADPSLETRKYIGWFAMLYLLIATIILYLAKKRIWSRVKH